MSNRAYNKLAMYAFLVALAALFGPVYGLLFVPNLASTPMWPMALDGAIGGSLLWGGMMFLWPSRLCAPLRRLAFPWHVIILLVFVALCIPLTGTISLSLRTGQFVVFLWAGTGWSLYLYILAITTLTLVVIQVTQVIGGRVLGNMLIGRYHRPVEERRIFLFIDLKGSTALARQLGDLGVQQLLTRVFFDMGQPIAEYGGEIHAYVGDEVIITWPFAKGAEHARCVRCFFAVIDRLRSNASSYERLFGVTPGFRAGLHGGPVVVSECGDTKKSIVFFGDTMNTTARLEGEAKRLNRSLIVSGELVQSLNLPNEYIVEPMGDVTLHGHTSATALVALSRTDGATA